MYTKKRMYASTLHTGTGFLARMFPPPQYLTMPAVGIDISDYSIKYILLHHVKGRVVLGAHGKVDLPIGTIEHGEIKDPTTLTKILTKLRRDTGFEYVHLALPEEHAYLFQMDFPRATQDEVEQMLEFHLKENVPIAAEEAVFDYNIIKETNASYLANVSVYPAPIASLYLDTLVTAGLKPLSVELEGQATARALLRPDDTSTNIIIDVGRSDASLSISVGGIVGFTASLELGGDHFTRSISRHLSLSFQEAEKLKRDYGFADVPENSSVYSALLPTIQQLKEAISKHYLYWQMHADSGLGSTEVSRVILIGGNANLRGMAEYMEVGLEVPIEIGNVWQNVFSFEEVLPPQNAHESLEFATAVGLALRSVMRGA
jgi:type IV pilus assembly protein PilM